MTSKLVIFRASPPPPTLNLKKNSLKSTNKNILAEGMSLPIYNLKNYLMDS